MGRQGCIHLMSLIMCALRYFAYTCKIRGGRERARERGREGGREGGRERGRERGEGGEWTRHRAASCLGRLLGLFPSASFRLDQDYRLARAALALMTACTATGVPVVSRAPVTLSRIFWKLRVWQAEVGRQQNNATTKH